MRPADYIRVDNVGIDSMEVRVPLSKGVKVLDNRLKKGIVVESLVDENGEVHDLSEKQNPRTIYNKDKGLSFKFRIKKVRHTKGEFEDCIFMAVNSKLLGTNYFDGINSNNFEKIIGCIMDQGVVKVPFDSVVGNGKMTDTDFFIDQHITFEKHRHIIDMFKQMTIPSSLRDKGYKFYSGKNNHGIEWGLREKATAHTPFAKVYWKPYEMLSKSAIFTKMYFENDGMKLDERSRVEITLKNARAFKRFGLNSNDVKDIVYLHSSKLVNVINDVLDVHMDREVEPIKMDKKLSVQDQFTINSFSLYYENGMTESQVRDIYLRAVIHKQNYQYHSNKFNELFGIWKSSKKLDAIRVSKN